MHLPRVALEIRGGESGVEKNGHFHTKLQSAKGLVQLYLPLFLHLEWKQVAIRGHVDVRTF